MLSTALEITGMGSVVAGVYALAATLAGWHIGLAAALLTLGACLLFVGYAVAGGGEG